MRQRYPRVGRPNAVVDLYVADVATGARVKVDLGANPDIYLARADWAKDGRTLYVQRLTRDQKRLDLLAVDPATGAASVILTETSPHWVGLTDDFTPLKIRPVPVVLGARREPPPLPLRSATASWCGSSPTATGPSTSWLGVDEARRVAIFTASKDTPDRAAALRGLLRPGPASRRR